VKDPREVDEKILELFQIRRKKEVMVLPLFQDKKEESDLLFLKDSPCSFRLGFPIILRFGMHLLNFSLVPLPKKPHLLRQCVQRTKGANYDILIRRTEGEDTEDYALWPHQKKRKRKKFRTLNIGSFFFLSF